MTQNFIIRKGKESIIPYFLMLFLFLFIFRYSSQQSYIGSFLILFFTIPILVYLIMFFRWTISFAVLLDMEKKEIILNHSLFFHKKKISLEDIKEIDVLNGNIVLFSTVHLSKCQRMVCKTKKSDDYTVSFETIDACERKQLMELLSTLK